MDEDTNRNEADPEQEKKGIPLRWIFYTILAYAFFQMLYFWWSLRGE